MVYDPVLKRVWVLDRRVHHGLTGLLLALLGTLLMVHDRADWRDWL